MTTQTTKNERTIEQIEAELSNVENARQRIAAELEKLAGELDTGLRFEAERFEQAVRQGQEPKGSKKVQQTEQRIAELRRQEAVVEPLVLKLQAERTVIQLREAEADRDAKGEVVEERFEQYREAEAALEVARNEVSWANGRCINLRDQLGGFRRRLAELGHTDPEEIAEREENARQAEQMRQQLAEHEKKVNREGLADAGLVPTDSAEFRREVQAGRVKVAGIMRLPGEEDRDG